MDEKRWRQALGEQVTAARKMRHWNQTQLAKAAGISPKTTSSIENGESVQGAKLEAVLGALELENISETQDSAGYPRDVELMRELVTRWLLAIPDDEQAEKWEALLRYMFTLLDDK